MSDGTVTVSYIESKVVGPLSDDSVARVGGVGHLELEYVVAPRGVSILIEQNPSSCTAYRTTQQQDG